MKVGIVPYNILDMGNCLCFPLWFLFLGPSIDKGDEGSVYLLTNVWMGKGASLPSAMGFKQVSGYPNDVSPREIKIFGLYPHDQQNQSSPWGCDSSFVHLMRPWSFWIFMVIDSALVFFPSKLEVPHWTYLCFSNLRTWYPAYKKYLNVGFG